MLATKNRWATSKAARQATLAAAEAVAEAEAAEDAGEEFGSKKEKGRSRLGKTAPKTAAVVGAAGASISAAAAAAVAEAAAVNGGREAAVAHVEARLALDAAAAVEIGRLQEALGLGAADARPQTAEQSRAALASQYRGPTAFNIFYRSEWQQGSGTEGQRGAPPAYTCGLVKCVPLPGPLLKPAG